MAVVALSEVDLGFGGIGVRVLDYAEHALTSGGDAEAVSYLELEVGERVLQASRQQPLRLLHL